MMPSRRRSIGFPLVCALAYAGGVVGYMPLLTLLLPMQVAGIAGPDRFAVLASVSIVGALAASGANIAFGWLSDRSRQRGGGRRWWMAAGLVGTLASFAAVDAARDVTAITLAIVAFQVALNALLAPMMALIAEETPAARTGITTGLFAAGPPLASFLSLALAARPLAGEGARLVVVGAAMTACLLPLLLSRARAATGGVAAPVEPPPPRRDLALAWISRLLVQVAGSVLFADLVYLMEEPGDGGDGRTTLARIGSLLIVANLAPLLLSVLFGRWSDRIARRKPFLLATAALAACGLTTMAASADWGVRAAGFLLFSIGWGSFLALQVGYIMRLLRDPDRRGRDLGLVNLANTLPVLIGQALAWLMATPRHAAPFLVMLAGLVVAGGLTTLGIRGHR